MAFAPPLLRRFPGPGAVLGTSAVRGGGRVVGVADDRVRRRSRQNVRRSKAVMISLTEEEYAEVSAAAQRLGLARAAFAATAALAAARGDRPPAGEPLGEAVRELVHAAALARRIGTNLNQAVARLNSTGRPGADLLPAARFCQRVIARMDQAAEQVRRSIP
jgi:hypothetical protein